MDDYLEVRNLKEDGIPQVLFHSGYRGASDSETFEHLLFYDRSKVSFADLAPESFYTSGRHGLRWLNVEGRMLVVIADENWPTTTRLEDRCHDRPSPFRYDVYQWSNARAAFEIYRHLDGAKPYSEANEALEGDWALIQAGLSREIPTHR